MSETTEEIESRQHNSNSKKICPNCPTTQVLRQALLRSPPLLTHKDIINQRLDPLDQEMLIESLEDDQAAPYFSEDEN